MRIFFDLVNKTDVISDKDGVEVEHPSEIRALIAGEVAEMVQEISADDRRGWQLRVKDEAGDVLFTIPLDSGAV